MNLMSVVFDALPAYYMSLFRVPRVVAEAIEKIREIFYGMNPMGSIIASGLLGTKFVDQRNAEV